MSDQRCSDSDQSKRDIPSFIEPRPPLVLNPFMRPRPQKGTNLLELFEDDSESEEPEWVQVYLRLKPCNVRNNLYEVKSDRCLITSVDTAPMGHGRRTQHNVSKMYTFSHIFGPDSSQKEIFELVVKDNLKKLPEGHNFTLLTYGASGSGKTYTLMGNVQSPGLVPRSLEYVFKVVDAAQAPLYKPADGGFDKLEYYDQDYELQFVKRLRQVSAPLREKYRRMSAQLHNDLTASTIDLSNRSRYYVWVSFVEIYNEAIYDLLSNSDRSKATSKLRIREDASGNVYVKGATHAFVRSGSEAYDVLVAGKHNLQVAATGVHANSSRSHCIFTITMLTETDDGVRTSCVRLCDLAGCERVRHTKNTGARMQESRAINSSLHVLERCLHMLRRKQKKIDATLVPYRESKLTRLLGAGLSGARGEAVSMVVTLNPAPHYAHETRHVLQLAAVARDIQVNQTIAESTLESSAHSVHSGLSTTESDAAAIVMKLRADNERLHFELVQAEARNKELKAALEDKQQEAAKNMFEYVQEAKDMTRQYYESLLQSLKDEMEEMKEDYENQLKLAAMSADIRRISADGATPSKALRRKIADLMTEIAILEEKLTIEKLARARAEEEVQHLRACIDERDDKAVEELAENEDAISLNSESDEDDPYNESLEPTFKKEDINRSRILQQSLLNDSKHNSSLLNDSKHSSSLLNDSKSNTCLLTDSKHNTVCSDSEDKNGTLRYDDDDTVSCDKSDSSIVDSNSKDDENNETKIEMTESDTSKIGKNYDTENLNKNDVSKIDSIISNDDLMAVSTTNDNIVDVSLRNESRESEEREDNLSQNDRSNQEEEFGNTIRNKSALIRGTYVVSDDADNINKEDINNTDDINNKSDDFEDCEEVQSKNDALTGFKESIKEIIRKSQENLLHCLKEDIRTMKEAKVTKDSYEYYKARDTATQLKSHQSDISLAQFEQIENDTKTDEFHARRQLSNDEIFSNIKILKEKRTHFFDDKTENSLLPKLKKDKTYFDNINIKLEPGLKINEAKTLNDDRSPSIVKEEVGKNVQPSMIQKLLEESFTRQQEHVAKPTKQASVDIFDGFDSPQVFKAPQTSKVVEDKSDVSEKSMGTKKVMEMLSFENAVSSIKGFNYSIKTEKDEILCAKPLEKLDANATFEKLAHTRDKPSIFEECVEKSVKPPEERDDHVEDARRSIENMVLKDMSFKKPKEKRDFGHSKVKQDQFASGPQIHDNTVTNDTQEILISSNNTVDDFEKIYRDLSTARATEFDLLVTQLSTTNIPDTTLNIDNLTGNVKLKYNLRHTKATSGEKKDTTSLKRDKSADKKPNEKAQEQIEKLQPTSSSKEKKTKEHSHHQKSLNIDETSNSKIDTKDKDISLDRKANTTEEIYESEAKCESKAKPKRNLRLRRRKGQGDLEDGDKKLKDIVNLQKEFSDVCMDVPAPVKDFVKDIESPKKVEEDENLPPLLGIQSCPSKSVTRSRRKLFTPRAEPLEESMAASGDSHERVRVPRPSYHRTRARRKL